MRLIKISRSKHSLAFRILEKIPKEFEEEVKWENVGSKLDF